MNGFEAWMHAVDRFCEKLCGMSIYDLPDMCYRDWYEDGMKPAAAARKAIKAAKEEM